MNQVMECHHLKIGEAFLEITPIDLTQKWKPSENQIKISVMVGALGTLREILASLENLHK
jgi:hypothetical protein